MANLFEPAHTFVETGTYEGKTLKLAVESGMYKRIVSIELDRSLYVRVVQEPWPRHVELYRGDSPDVLEDVLNADELTLIFLDAHRTGRGGGKFTGHGRNGECPVINELAAIDTVPWKIWPTIKIHDARMFRDDGFWGSRVAQHFDRSQWPTEDDIFRMAEGYCSEIDDDTIVLRRST